MSDKTKNEEIVKEFKCERQTLPTDRDEEDIVCEYIFKLIRGLTEQRILALRKLIDRLKHPESESLKKKQVKPYKGEVWTLSELAKELNKSAQDLTSGNTLDFLIKYGLLYPIPKIRHLEHSILYTSPIVKWIKNNWKVTERYAIPKDLSTPRHLIPIMEDVLKEIETEINEDCRKTAVIRHYVLGYIKEVSPECNIKEVIVKYKIVKQEKWNKWYLNIKNLELECTFELEKPLKDLGFEPEKQKEVLVSLKRFLESAFKNYIYASAGYYEEQAKIEANNKDIENEFEDPFERRLKKAEYIMTPDPEKEDISEKTRFTAKIKISLE